MKLIFEKSSKGRSAIELPELDVPEQDNLINPEFLRDDLNLPEVSEIDVVRHYTALSRRNFGVDLGFYPLGSCTMKYNPKINEDVAKLPGFSMLHPLAPEELSQGSLQMMYELERDLSEIFGMDKFTLQPAAGAHGELTGVMIIKKYFEDLGENRTKILIPDSAHGTNPASVALCGFDCIEVKSDADGNVDLENLKKLVDKDVAALMLTNPNTLGLFDKNTREISAILKENGSLFYCDGANGNAMVGTVKAGDLGFDIIQLNLHKTFSTPHGCGGPGSGPVGVKKDLVKYLPNPVAEKKDSGFRLNYDNSSSIGQVRAFYGNFGVMVKAYTYIRAIGAKGLRDVSQNAVLNANYMMKKLKKYYHLPYDRVCQHEFVLSDKDVPNDVTTNDIAKRLLDYGFHAPTIYFPLIVSGSIMIEPTETESKETMDSFIDIMVKIKDEASSDPEIVKSAPLTTPVKKLDGVLAARKPDLKYG